MAKWNILSMAHRSDSLVLPPADSLNEISAFASFFERAAVSNRKKSIPLLDIPISFR
jgi:hypothetical protein